MSEQQPPSPVRLDYQRPTAKKPLRRIVEFVGVLFFAICMLVLALSVFPPDTGQSRARAQRVRCASNMHQIGLAILLYANENGGQYPSDFRGMLDEGLTAGTFVCPASSDTPSGGPLRKRSIPISVPAVIAPTSISVGA